MSDVLKIIADKIPVSEIYWNILKNENLWNKNKNRTENKNSPHFGLDDIWVRFGKPQDVGSKIQHEINWDECAETLNIKNVCFDLMRVLNGVELGGVLLTRIKAGLNCKPHIDSGWHAARYKKYLLQIASAPGQFFCFEDLKYESKPGDLFYFDNSKTHWVENNSKYERVSLIICIKE